MALAALACGAASPGAATDIRVKISDVGQGSAPGEIRRTIQPFGGWTLICDENVKRRERVCNVSQILVDAAGQQVFSWSLAATRGGTPVMIVRAPGRLIQIRLGPKGRLRDVALPTCNEAVCLGLLPVDKEIAEAIRRGSPAEIMLSREGRFASVEASTAGLATALRAVR